MELCGPPAALAGPPAALANAEPEDTMTMTKPGTATAWLAAKEAARRAKKEASRRKEQERAVRHEAAVRLQSTMRRFLCMSQFAIMNDPTLGRKSELILAERFKYWQKERRLCQKPGYPGTFISPRAAERERQLIEARRTVASMMKDGRSHDSREVEREAKRYLRYLRATRSEKVPDKVRARAPGPRAPFLLLLHTSYVPSTSLPTSLLSPPCPRSP